MGPDGLRVRSLHYESMRTTDYGPCCLLILQVSPSSCSMLSNNSLTGTLPGSWSSFSKLQQL